MADGVPVYKDGIPLGAVAVSGLTEQLDQDYVQIGFQTILEPLP